MVYAQSIREESSTARHDIGTVRENLADNTKYIYSRAGASAIAAGVLTQSALPIASAAHTNKVVKAAAAIGAKQVKMLIGGTAITADQYAGGKLLVNDATGEKYAYKIKGHGAYSASSAAVIINLADDDPIQVALVASTSEVSLIKNQNNGVIINPVTATATPCGITPIAVTANYYFWAQVKGPAAVLANGTLAMTSGVVASSGSGSVAGAVMPQAAGTVTPTLGTVMYPAATTEYALINLDIPGY